MKKYILLVMATALLFSSCEDLFTPSKENFKDISQMYKESAYAQAFVTTAYRNIPTYYDNSDYATDDAVTNQKSNSFLQIATGSWTASNNPFDSWNNAYGTIQYLNLFLDNTDKITWVEDPEASKLFNIRMKGEAYGLRALYMYYLLRAHAGVTADGQLLGAPIVNKYLTVESDFNLPRATFAQCVKQIYQDLDSAELFLPTEYVDLPVNGTVPARYQSITTKYDVYNRVMGVYARQLFNGLIAKSFRTRTALLAASPAFQHSSNTATWANAADYAAGIIDYKGGIAGLPANGVTYYANTSEIDALKEGNNPPEMIWRENLIADVTNAATYNQESQNYPPSLFGSGFMNPTQNLVDAFPDKNGYPITAASTLYVSSNPYANRDPRLAKYIFYDGSTGGVSNTVIKTGSASVTNDGINKIETSTRTGYYMKKRLRMDVNRKPGSTNGKSHYLPRIRYTEMYLAYAEAANEAWGPLGAGTHSYSAYDVIKAIRKRALAIATDPYLESIKNDKDAMRGLIRNERRLELCFESFRFWDLRRWKANLNESARGLDVNGTTITPLNSVEVRSYKDYMYYGPIPYSETVKFSNLTQNKGWM
jgi:starch-binding outer membrane protein, SusD/RagB family